MNQDTHDSQPERDQDGPATRRKFLRQVGMTAAATAAVAGLADVAGMKPAFAAAKSKGVPARAMSPSMQKKIQEIRSVHPDTTLFYSCALAPGHCGGPCHPSGVWCHNCCYVSNYCGGPKIECIYSCNGGDYYFCSSLG